MMRFPPPRSVTRAAIVRRLVAGGVMVALAAVGGCGSDGDDCGGFVSPTRTLTPSPATITVDIGGEARLAATLSGGCPGDPTAVTWRATDSAVVRVTDAGVVTALAPGTTTIIATAFDGVTRASVPVTVRALVATRIVASPELDTLSPAATRTLTAVVRDQRDSVLAGAPLAWRSLTPALATVTAAGVVTASAIGTARVEVATPRAAGDSLRDTVTIAVVNPCTRVRSVPLGGGYDGSIDASSCRAVAGVTVFEPLRITGAPGGQPLVALLELTPRFTGALVPMVIGSTFFAQDQVAADQVARAIVVLAPTAVGDATIGFAVTSSDALRPGPFPYRVAATANPNPAQRCIVTATTRGVDFETALFPGAQGAPACTAREVEILPPLMLGGSITALVTGPGLTVQLISNGPPRTVLRTATTPAGGGTANLSFTALGTTQLRLRITGTPSAVARVRVQIN